MEIAMMVWEFPPRIVGGLGTYAMEISQRFVKLGHDVTVFTINDGKSATRDVWRGVEVHRPMLTDIADAFAIVVPEIAKWGRGLIFFSEIFVYNVLSASKLVNDLVKKEGRRFDLIVAHDWLSVISGMAAKKELNKPFLFHVHSTEKGRTMNSGTELIANLEYQGGKKADLVVTVSQAMRDELISQGFQEGKIRVCYNGVDAEKYNPDKVDPGEVENLRKRYGINEGDKMVFFIGRLMSVKGVDRLIMAMPHVLRKVPNTKLVVVGIGEMQSYLTNLVGSMKLENNVMLRYEFIPEEERILHYAACDVGVFPSLYEPFGIVCLEAMSMGKPVVIGAAGISGMREVVVPNGPYQCGYHVNPYEPTDIAWGITSILADPTCASKFGANARKRVLDYFTWETAAKNTIRVYKELLKAEGGTRGVE